jgi:hypothetical protein
LDYGRDLGHQKTFKREMHALGTKRGERLAKKKAKKEVKPEEKTEEAKPE